MNKLTGKIHCTCDKKYRRTFYTPHKIGRQLREFNFRLRDEKLYDTDTADSQDNRIYFKMQKVENSWKIQGASLPSWIVENETVISMR